MQEIQLSNGKTVGVKRLGARSQARAFDILLQIADDPEFQHVFSGFQGGEKLDEAGVPEILKMFRLICSKKWDQVEQLALLVSTLEARAFEDEAGEDGETGEAVGIDDLFAIFIVAFQINNFAALIERLGNVFAPSADNQAGGAKSQDDMSHSSSSSLTNLPVHTAGQPPNLMRSISAML